MKANYNGMERVGAKCGHSKPLRVIHPKNALDNDGTDDYSIFSALHV